MKFNLSTSITMSLRLEATEQFEYEGALWPRDEHPYRALIRTFTASGEPANNPEDLRYTMQGTAIRKDGTAGVFNRTYYGRVWSDLPERVQDGIRAAWRLSVTSGKGLRDWTPPAEPLRGAASIACPQCRALPGVDCTSPNGTRVQGGFHMKRVNA